ncbi:MAG: tetratricopeptide repeat protein [Bacteroidales bacterium]|nr:tetratricopeptide repeat protein [Bacteroidales bacterium]
MICKKKLSFLSLALVALLLIILVIYKQGYAQDLEAYEAYYNELGLDHFNKGYYDALPKNKKDEASLYFEKAITAFKTAIAINKDCIQSHKNLGRVYYVQKKFIEAAEQYQKVTELNPSDIDAYVITALAYTRINRYDKAIEQLKIAKSFSSDKAVIQKIDDYINKIEQEKRMR